MFKKEFGLAIYPEHATLKEIQNYLILGKKYGFKKVFLSWIHWSEPNKYTDLYLKVIKIIKNFGYYIVLDVANDSFYFYSNLDVDCLRLDAPILPKQVADLTYSTKMDYQINISNNDQFINNILDYQPVKENLFGSHNFYLRKGSGLGWEYFKKTTKKFNDLGINTSAFINSQTAKYSAKEFEIKFGATTIEKLRFLPLKTQAKYLLATKQIDTIYIANQFASEEELKAISELDLKNIELDINLTKNLQTLEKEILLDSHFNRGDINENYLRSTMSRVNYKNREIIEPDNLESKIVTLKKGDVIIINHNDLNYEKELNIILKETKMDQRIFNLIGHVSRDDKELIDFIVQWQHFNFKIL